MPDDTQWKKPALARLKSDRDLDVTIGGKCYLVTAALERGTNGDGPSVQIEFWRDGKAEQCVSIDGASILEHYHSFRYSAPRNHNGRPKQ